MHIFISIGSVWASVTVLWLFCCTVFFLLHTHRSYPWMDFHWSSLKRRGSAQGGAFCGYRRYQNLFR